MQRRGKALWRRGAAKSVSVARHREAAGRHEDAGLRWPMPFESWARFVDAVLVESNPDLRFALVGRAGRDERAGIPVAAHYFVVPTWQTPRGFVAIYDRANERPAARFVSMVGSPLPFVSLERPETFLPFDRDEAGARDAARAIAAFLMRPPG